MSMFIVRADVYITPGGAMFATEVMVKHDCRIVMAENDALAKDKFEKYWLTKYDDSFKVVIRNLNIGETLE